MLLVLPIVTFSYVVHSQPTLRERGSPMRSRRTPASRPRDRGPRRAYSPTEGACLYPGAMARPEERVTLLAPALDQILNYDTEERRERQPVSKQFDMGYDKWNQPHERRDHNTQDVDGYTIPTRWGN